MSRLRLPSRRARISAVRRGRPCRSVKSRKASSWRGMLATSVPSRSKMKPRGRREGAVIDMAAIVARGAFATGSRSALHPVGSARLGARSHEGLMRAHRPVMQALTTANEDAVSEAPAAHKVHPDAEPVGERQEAAMGAEPDLLWVKGERSRRFRFGIFELDPRGGELWKGGVRTRLQPQPGARPHPAREPFRRARHARGDPARGLAGRDVRRFRAVAELLHPPDPDRPRRPGGDAPLRRDAAPPRISAAGPGRGGGRTGSRARGPSGAQPGVRAELPRARDRRFARAPAAAPGPRGRGAAVAGSWPASPR